MINTNYLGSLRMCHAVIALMRQQGSGTIVNVSSMDAQEVFAFAGGYAASKAAMEAMSRATPRAYCGRHSMGDTEFFGWVRNLDRPVPAPATDTSINPEH